MVDARRDTVLLLEPNPEQRCRLVNAITAAGYDSVSAGDGGADLADAMAGAPVLALIHVEPDDLSCLVLLAGMREIPGGADVPLAVMTRARGRHLEKLERIMTPLNVARFVRSPIPDERVATVISGALEAPRPVPAAAEPASMSLEEVRALHRVIAKDETTHFERLGVARDATLDDIRGAYTERMKRLRPADIPVRSEDDRSAVVAVYESIAEAYAVLRDPAHRARYESELAAVQADRTIEVPALKRTENGARLDYWSRNQFDCPEMWESRATAARMRAMMGDYEGAADLILDAIRLRPSDAALKYRRELYLGWKFKRAGNRHLSRRHFTAALTMAPPGEAAPPRAELDALRPRNQSSGSRFLSMLTFWKKD